MRPAGAGVEWPRQVVPRALAAVLVVGSLLVAPVVAPAGSVPAETASAGLTSDRPAGGSAVVSVTAARVADTRPGASTVDALFVGAGAQPAGSEYRIQIAGRGGAPADAVGAVINVTAVDPQADGFLTTHPCVAPPPVASTLNYTTGVNVANEVVAGLAADGSVCVFTSATTDLIVDMVGYLPHDSVITPVTPARVHESREGAPTVDNRAAGTARTTAGSTTAVEVTGRAGVPTEVDAVIVNVTAVDPTASGFVTVHACLASTPVASSLNYVPGVNRANELITPTNADGEICVYTQHDLDLVVDVAGYITPGTNYRDDVQARLLETRPGAPTIDGANQGEGIRPAGSVYTLPVAGRGGVPSDATTAIVNVTAVDPEATGFVTVHPCATTPPNTSSLNYTAGVNSANELVVELAAGGELCVFTHAPTHVLVDVVGYLQPTGTVKIVKLTDPAGGTAFGFTDTIAAPNSFTLDDDQTLTFTDVAPGAYTVVEDDPTPGADLTSVACDDSAGPTPSNGDVGTRTATINLDPGETVTCTFANTARGAIAVEAASTGCFDHPLPYPTLVSFVGDVAGLIWTFDPPTVVDDLVPGTYTSTLVGNCTVVSIQCDDDNSTGSEATATFKVEPGETVTCKFVADCCPPPYDPPCPPICPLKSPRGCPRPPSPAL